MDTHDDRTSSSTCSLFFETHAGLKVKVKLFTVPGQVIHGATRKLVLQNADAVAFIADSQREATADNNKYWAYLQQNLRDNGLDPAEIPVVIQFNKLDLPNAKTAEEVEEVRKRGSEPVFGAVAVRGEGVMETFYGLLQNCYRSLDRRHGIASRLGMTEDEFLRGVFKGIDLKGTTLEGLAGAP